MYEWMLLFCNFTHNNPRWSHYSKLKLHIKITHCQYFGDPPQNVTACFQMSVSVVFVCCIWANGEGSPGFLWPGLLPSSCCHAEGAARLCSPTTLTTECFPVSAGLGSKQGLEGLYICLLMTGCCLQDSFSTGPRSVLRLILYRLKGSYDAFLKIIIWCIWCNRIYWYALMLKKHVIFQILYIIVVPLCPASLKRLVFYKAPSSNNHSVLWLANWPSAVWLAEHHKQHRKCNAPFHNHKLQLSK